MNTMFAETALKQALPFNELKAGMQVVIMTTLVTMTEEWINIHTGTILAIDTHNKCMTFDLPNKEFDKNPTIPLHRFNFKEVEDSHDNRMYLLDATMVPAMDVPTKQWFSQ